MDVQILEDVGLTRAETKVYLALIELGNATAGPVIEKSGLQNSVVHLTLNRLIEKGFVSFVKDGKRKYYQASDPRHILEYIDEKKKKMESILPQLLSKQNLSKQKPEIITFRGKRGIKELLYELLDAGGKEHHTISSPKESLMMGEAFWIEYHRKRTQKGIFAKLLFNQSLKSWKGSEKYKKCHVRYTEKEFEPLTETIIRNDTVGIIIWSEKPIGILIHNKIVADSYESFFQMLWKSSRR